ncbi:MAG: hypothetical protein IPK88_04305 [Saprospiraceae bacterium]|nr:hypothetical protein [Candidatus Defluviibacterium haderslevense]MBK8242626.1 hypothetical protein [Candidatus Defluviibacterium haderslevense]
MSKVQNSNNGCLGLSSTGWFWLIFVSVLLTIVDKCCYNGHMLDEPPFENIYKLGSHVEVAFEVKEFTSSGKVGEFQFMNLVEKIWNYRGELYKQSINEFEIIFIVNCVDKYGNKNIREAGRYILDKDDLDYLYKCKDELAYKNFSHLESFLKLSFKDNCRGKIYEPKK